jgi:hypothetical protein
MESRPLKPSGDTVPLSERFVRREVGGGGGGGGEEQHRRQAE